MTIEHAPSTNGRVHTDGAKPGEPRAYETTPVEPDEASGIGKLVAPLLLIVVALVVLRRLNQGNVA